MAARPLILLAAMFVFASVTSSLAEPRPDPSHTLTVQVENDSTVPHSDEYYTSGLRLGYTSPTGDLPEFLANLGHSLLGGGQQRLSAELTQLILTPHFTGDVDPPLNDRPYAGILMGTVSLIQDTDRTRTALGVGIGLIGPAALGRQVQNGFHTLIGQTRAQGWATQIPNQPIIQLTAERIWRVPTGRIGPLETDVLPSVTAGAGTFRIYAQAGGQLRIGQGLDSDFGAPRIHPGLTGTDAYVQSRTPLAWYVFLGVDGQAVAWDETLDGLPFGSSRHVTREPFVGEFQAGIAFLIWGMRITGTQVLQTHEFVSQRAGLFSFSSVSLSMKF